jgi:nucleoside-diphosphate-sugar epimerase
MATVLVTGGFGFIGAHVVRELLVDGSRVSVIDRETDGNAADEVLSAVERRAVERVAGEIPGVRTLTRLLRERKIDVIVHLASPLATATERRPRSSVDQMVLPHVAILDACRAARVKRLVWASSVGVFGRIASYPGLPLANDALHAPVTVYGAAKSFLERLSSQYATCFGLDSIGLRFPLVYGPGRRRGGGQFTTEMIESAAFGRRCVVEAADTRNDWMYVGDAARSVLMAVHAGPLSERALTVGGEVATTREVATMLQAWFPTSELVLRDGAGDLVADFDSSPARAQLGYRPATTLRDGVLATANAARVRSGLPPAGDSPSA